MDGSVVDTFPMTDDAAMQVSVAEMGDLTRVDTDEESLPRNHSMTNPFCQQLEEHHPEDV